MLRTQAMICAAGMWVMAAGLLWAAGFALRSALRRRLVLGSRLFVWRAPHRVIQGADAVHTSIVMFVIISVLAVVLLAASIKATMILSQIPSSTPQLSAHSLERTQPAPAR